MYIGGFIEGVHSPKFACYQGQAHSASVPEGATELSSLWLSSPSALLYLYFLIFDLKLISNFTSLKL